MSEAFPEKLSLLERDWISAAERARVLAIFVVRRIIE
jgi:hypothetical protein